jgi:hypothetical protein
VCGGEGRRFEDWTGMGVSGRYRISIEASREEWRRLTDGLKIEAV